MENSLKDIEYYPSHWIHHCKGKESRSKGRGNSLRVQVRLGEIERDSHTLVGFETQKKKKRGEKGKGATEMKSLAKERKKIRHSHFNLYALNGWF